MTKEETILPSQNFDEDDERSHLSFASFLYGFASVLLALFVSFPLIPGVFREKQKEKEALSPEIFFSYLPMEEEKSQLNTEETVATSLRTFVQWQEPTQMIFPGAQNGFSGFVKNAPFWNKSLSLEKPVLAKPQDYETEQPFPSVLLEPVAEVPAHGYGSAELEKGFFVEPPRPVTETPQGIYWTSRSGYFLDHPPKIELEKVLPYREQLKQNRTTLEVIPTLYQPRILIRESCGCHPLDEIASLALRGWFVQQGSRWEAGPSVVLDVYWYLGGIGDKK